MHPYTRGKTGASVPAHPWSRPGPLSRAHSGPLSRAIGLGHLLTPQDYLCDQRCAKTGPDSEESCQVRFKDLPTPPHHGL